MPAILVVDDELSIRKALAISLRDAGYTVVESQSRAEAFANIDSTSFDLIITDLFIPFETDGIEIIKYTKQRQPEALLLMITGHGSIERAVDAIKAGADDFLAKGFLMEELLFRIGRLFDQKHLRKEREQLAEDCNRMQRELESRYRFANIVAASAPMRAMFSLMERIIEDNDSTVLIEGESGTGKELVARAIHYNSTRKSKPFIVVNCAALPEHLLESELFGYTKGAFTGALKDKPGKFEIADGGTIFLDEIGEVSARVQVALLRFTQDHIIERIGSNAPMRVDVRVIVATNKQLEREVAEGRFREDLFYRLHVVPITIPPLRERREDIPLLVEHFLEQRHAEGKKRLRCSPEAMHRFERYLWKGNVRELENVLHRLVITAEEDTIYPDALPDVFLDRPENFPTASSPEMTNLSDACEAFERAFILRQLEAHRWNVTETADAIGERRDTLSKKIKRYGLREG